LEATIRRGVQQALDDLQPVRIRYGLHQAHFGISRRRPDALRRGKVTMAPNPEGYYDPDLPILTFHTPDDRAFRALFYSYGCHPTSKSGNRISADYPGELSRALRRALGENVITLFAQGAGASVMPRHGCRTAEERAAYAARWEAVARDMAVFVQKGRMQDVSLAISSAEREFHIPYDMSQMLSEDDLMLCADPAEPPLPWFTRPANREILRLWAAGILEKIRTGTLPDGFAMHATRLRLSAALQIIGLSGEVTAEVGRRVKEAEKPLSTLFLGYCSYTDAYIPTAAMLPEEGHEAAYSMYFHMRPAPFVKEIDDIILREVAATALP
jgi:hypothetical protein